jgi:flagellar assembly protein FliH
LNKRIVNNKFVVLDKTFELSVEEIEQTQYEENKREKDKLKEAIESDAQKEAQKIIENAKITSQKIIENAELEAKRLKEDQIKYVEERKKTLEEELKKVRAQIQRISKEYDIYIKELSQQSLNFCENTIKAVVERYFKEKFDFPQWVEIIFQNFEKKLSSMKNSKIKLSPSFNKEYANLIRDRFSDFFYIVEDPSLQDNQIVLETDQGIFDLTPQTFFEDILNMVEEAINANK